MKNDLLKEMKRLLEFAGAEVKQIHETADGATALVDFNDEEHRVFLCPVKPFDRILEEPVSEY